MKTKLANIYITGITLFFIFVLGVLLYMKIENFTFLDAIFMTVITMSTVGYEEVKPLSDAGMIITMGLIVSSLGLFAYLITSLTRLFIDGDYKTLLKQYYMTKQIEKLNKHVIVCGFGRNGRQAVIELLALKEDVVVIERSDEVVFNSYNEEIVKNKQLIYVNGDASLDESLIKANLNSARALITTLPNDAENLLIVLTVRDLAPDIRIIARASDDHSYSKLKRAGADNVIMPDIVGGNRMAKLVVQPDIVEFLEMIMVKEGVDVNLEEISCHDLAVCFVDNTISKLDIRKKTGANLIGLKLGNGEYVFNPSPQIQLKKDDKLFVLGTPQQTAKLKESLESGGFFNERL